MIANVALFALAAFFEIAGCFAFWVWLRRGGTPVVALVGIASLIAFALALTRVDSAFAGKSVRSIRRDLYRCVAGVALADRGTSADAYRHDRGCPFDRWSPDHHRVRRAGSLSVYDRPPRLTGGTYRKDSASCTCTAGCARRLSRVEAAAWFTAFTWRSRETSWALLAAAERRTHTQHRRSTWPPHLPRSTR